MEESVEIRDLRNGDWFWIHRNILENYTPKIGIIGLALYNTYASHAREKGKCFPSQKRISEILKISIPTIIKYNKILEAHKLIKIDSGKKDGEANIISLLRVRGIKQVKTRSKGGLEGGINLVKTKEKNIKEKNRKIKKDKNNLIKKMTISS